MYYLAFFLALRPVSRRSRKVFAPGKPWQNLKLTITELLYLYILNMNRGSVHKRSSKRIHRSVFRYRWTENGFAGPKNFRGFRKTARSVAMFFVTSNCPLTLALYRSLSSSASVRLYLENVTPTSPIVC